MAALSEDKRKLVKKVLLTELFDDKDVTVAAIAIDVATVSARTALRIAEHRERTNPDAHIDNFVEVTVPRYTDWEFKGHFRMFPDTFEMFCEWVAPHLPAERGITSEKKLLATLWMVANKESYRSVADRFGFNKGTLHRIVKSVSQTLVALRGDVIRWPQSRHELQQLSEDFQVRAAFPGVVGALDGTYIKIPGKTGEFRDPWICRKGFPAMHLQVVCSPGLLFLDVHTGPPGSVHDARVFRNSDLRTFLETAEGRLPQDFHLLGDSAYPLRDYLLVPFRDNGHLGPLERKYNFSHSQTRVDVERAIGLLKGKFRRLKDLDMTNTLDVPNVIFACCVVHNFIIMNNGVDTDDIDPPSDHEGEDVCEDGGRMAAEEKRLGIAHGLM